MESVNGFTQVGDWKAFHTDGGPHLPETLARMTICQCVGGGSNPEKVEVIHRALTGAHAAIQQSIRLIYKIAGGDDIRRRIINDALARDIATSLDAERQWYKET